MSQRLVVELSDDVYSLIERQAVEAQTSPAQVIVASLERYFLQQPSQRQARTEDQLQAARARFEQHFGAVDLGYATGADNEQIDADLAREYDDTHEER